MEAVEDDGNLEDHQTFPKVLHSIQSDQRHATIGKIRLRGKAFDCLGSCWITHQDL